MHLSASVINVVSNPKLGFSCLFLSKKNNKQLQNYAHVKENYILFAYIKCFMVETKDLCLTYFNNSYFRKPGFLLSMYTESFTG